MLEESVRTLKGIGEKKEKLLSNLGIKTVEDLIYYFPVNYEDRSRFTNLRDAADGELASFKVRVKGNPTSYRPRRGMNIIKVAVTDGTDTAYLTFFNQNYRYSQFKDGDEIYVSGKPKTVGIVKEFNTPVVSKKLGGSGGIGSINPVYPLTKGLSNKEVKKFVKESLKSIEEIPDIPEYIKEKYGLRDIHSSIISLHFPQDREDYLTARNTLSFSELLELQLGLLMLKNKRQKITGCTVFPKISLLEEFENSLPFRLTDAQRNSIKDIERDMESEKQMNRLIQGDVGSGKTMVAAYALLKAVKSGYQGAMMAPTEILARQHYESLKESLEEYGVNIELIVSNLKAKEKREAVERIKTGQADIVVGTHAIIEDYLEFSRLGIVITDEQHRFGVNQRAKLSNKGLNPDILVMTATPIPRTLALIVYGDLDISIIDEMPPGRKPVRTYGRRYNARKNIYDFVEKQIKSGRQAYVVCPMVEENEIMKLKSAEEVYEELKRVYRNINVGLLHGKMKSAEKDEIMNKFKDREIDLLVSTTVIEVGVNVPNANIMVIENSERFGLAQLHQLRGRVGRGKYQSYCILLTEGRSQVSIERIKTMQNTNDGFIISEKDLELRGPGEFFGLKQHGVPELRISKLPRDMKILSAVQILASEIMNEDSELKKEENSVLRMKLDRKIQL